ncbi:hypothetical protein Hanom_Chr03g00189031 [Helianthus anomalus]
MFKVRVSYSSLWKLVFCIEPGVSLEAASLFLWGRGKAVYILPSSEPTLALLSVGYTEYDDDDDDDDDDDRQSKVSRC